MRQSWQWYLSLFARYEKLIAPLVAAAKPARKGRRTREALNRNACWEFVRGLSQRLKGEQHKAEHCQRCAEA
jgi:hypothetical protein